MKDLVRLLATALLLVSSIHVNSQDVEELISKAKNLAFEQKYDEALAQFNRVFESGNADSVQLAVAYGHSGVCYEQMGQVNEAITNYEKSLQYRVPELSIYDQMIRLTRAEKKYKLQEWALVEKRKNFPEFSYIIEEDLISVYYKTKQYEQLLESVSKWLQSDSSSIKYRYYKGYAFDKLGQKDSALVAYKYTLELDPEHTSANMRLGNIIFSKANNNYAKKKKAYERIAKPSRVDYSNYQKSQEESKAIYRESEKYISKAYSQKPNDTLKNILFRIYTRIGDKEKADLFKVVK